MGPFPQNYQFSPSTADPTPIPGPSGIALQSTGYSSEGPPTWGYPASQSAGDRAAGYPPPVLPSIHTIGRPVGGPWSSTDDTSSAGGGSMRTPWSADPATYPPDDSWSLPVDQQSMGRYPNQGFSTTIQQAPYTAAPQYAQASAAFDQQGANSVGGAAGSATVSTIPPLPRHTYTRTLVGPLSSNATRLQDEHRKAGIFFLFQDLSIRTEGQCFSLTLALPLPI